MAAKLRFIPDTRPGVVGYLATVKVQDCISGRIVLNGKCSIEEYSTRAKALLAAERAASVVAWNMNAAAERKGNGNRYRMKAC